LAGPDFDGPLRLEIWLKLETEAEPIRDAMAELTGAKVAARAPLGSANLLLEDKERDSTARQEIEGLLETLQGREVELLEARAHVDVLKIEVDRGQQEVRLLTESLGERESELKSKGEELNLKKQELGATNADLERVQTELFLVQRQSADQKCTLDKSAREMASLRKETALQQKQLDSSAKELAATTYELAKVSGEVAVLKRQMLARQNVIDELRKKRFWEVLNLVPALRQFLHLKRDRVSSESGMFIDLPRKLQETFWLEHPAGPTLAGQTIIVSGWVVTRSGEKIEGVQATVNGDKTPGVYGLARADVAAAHKGVSDYLHSGFVIELALPAGIHRVSLQWLTRSSGWDTFCSFQHEVREALE
jgi:hypothetical protein